MGKGSGACTEETASAAPPLPAPSRPELHCRPRDSVPCSHRQPSPAHQPLPHLIRVLHHRLLALPLGRRRRFGRQVASAARRRGRRLGLGSSRACSNYTAERGNLVTLPPWWHFIGSRSRPWASRQAGWWSEGSQLKLTLVEGRGPHALDLQDVSRERQQRQGAGWWGSMQADGARPASRGATAPAPLTAPAAGRAHLCLGCRHRAGSNSIAVIRQVKVEGRLVGVAVGDGFGGQRALGLRLQMVGGANGWVGWLSKQA